MKYRGIFEYEYPTAHKPPVSIDVHLHGDCVKGKIIEWEYRPLEQEPTTKNNLGVDLISRQEAINTIRQLYLDLASQKAVIDILKVLPSVTPQEPKTGYWIEHPHEAGPNWEYSMYECSECHDWSNDDSDYCPHCGVKMVESQERSGE